MSFLPAFEAKLPGSFDRSRALAETLRLAELARSRFGITRVADTTRLDRTTVPTFAAIAPEPHDIISVYNGKGRTPDAARAGAIMEAIERQCAARCLPQTDDVPLDAVCDALHLDRRELHDRAPAIVPCVEGTDLNDGSAVPLPCAFVAFPWRGARLLKHVSTNGLAAGNTRAEATYHALLEMVERHVWSLHYVRAELVTKFYGGAQAPHAQPAVELAFPTGDATLDALYERIVSASLLCRVLMLREGALPPVALALVMEERSVPPMAHFGLGCSLSSRHAVERALTEAVQSRVVDVQGAREDILRPDDPQQRFGDHGRRARSLPKNAWYADIPARRVSLDQLPERASDDLVADTFAVLHAMRACGIDVCAAVDIAPPNLPFSVVRVVAPRCETTTIDGRIGAIAMDEFNPLKPSVATLP